MDESNVLDVGFVGDRMGHRGVKCVRGWVGGGGGGGWRGSMCQGCEGGGGGVGGDLNDFVRVVDFQIVALCVSGNTISSPSEHGRINQCLISPICLV